MKFKSWLDPDSRSRVFAKPGSRVVTVFAPVVDEDGRIDLVEAGKHNLYAEIQSHKDSVDIHVILQRFKNGDISALDRRQGMFMDVTEMPGNYAEFLNSVIESQAFFDNLKPEVKNQFENFSDFIGSVGSEKFLKAFGFMKDEVKSDPVEQDPVEGGDQ